MNYRKKTEPVKAIQWTGENTAEVKAFLTEHCGPHRDVSVEPQLMIRCGQPVTARAGDYIVADPSCGVATAMSEDTFNANYAPAE